MLTAIWPSVNVIPEAAKSVPVSRYLLPDAVELVIPFVVEYSLEEKLLLVSWVAPTSAIIGVRAALKLEPQKRLSLFILSLKPEEAFIVLRKVLSFFKSFPQGENLKQDYFICLMGYASHGFLDAMTSYGTQLLWPFTNTRVSWDLISIIDPIFTSMLILGLILSMIKSKIITCT